MKAITVHLVPDVMRPSGRSVSSLPWSFDSVIGDYFPAAESSDGYMAMTTAGPVERSAWRSTPVLAGEVLSFVRWPEGELIVLGLAAAGIPGLTAAGVLTTTGTVVAGVASIALAAGASILANSLLGSIENPSEYTSPVLDAAVVNNFTGISTVAQAGNVIPVVIGAHPVGGNLLWYFVAAADPVTDPGLIILPELRFGVALCEGPIDGLEQIRIGGVPVAHTSGVGESTLGTLDQDPLSSIPFSGQTRVQSPVGIRLDNPNTTVATPPTDQDYWATYETNNKVDRIYANVFLPEGLSFLSGGSYTTTDVTWQYRYRLSSSSTSGWTGPGLSGVDYWGGVPSPGPTTFVEIEANYPYPFLTSTLIEFPTRDRYVIEFRRYSGRSTETKLDQLILDSVVEVVLEEYSHPGIVVAAALVQSNDTKAPELPQYVAVVRSETERWDTGTEDWVVDDDARSNPAWEVLKILRNRTWGLGNRVNHAQLEADIDLWIEWADWCDDLVDDGAGGLERRCMADAVLDGTDSSAWSAVQRIALAGDASIVKVGDRMYPYWERSRPVVAQFGMGNIIKGSFRQQWLSLTSNITRYDVRYLNAESDYQIDIASSEDPAAVNLGLPENPLAIDRFGIVRKSQARRRANKERKLARSQKVVEFRAGIDALRVQVGDLIRVSHDLPGWGVASGRILAATSTTVTIDRPAPMVTGITYEIHARLSDDTTEVNTIVLSDGLGGAPDPTAPITLQAAWGTTPDPGDPYIIGRPAQVGHTYVVYDVESSGDLEWTIRGLIHDPRIWDDADLT